MEILGCDINVIFMQLVVALTLTVVYVLVQFKLKPKLNIQSKPTCSDIPGPRPSDPVTGNFPDIVQAGSLPQYLQRVHEKYGDVVQIWFGQKAVVSTASPKVFREQMRLFDKPEMSFLAPVFGDRSIQFVNGEEAKRRRRTYDAFFKQGECRRIFYNIQASIALFGEYFEDDTNIQSFKTLYDEFWPVLEKNFTNGLPDEGTQEKKHFDQIVAEVHCIVKDIITKHKQSTQVRKFIDVVMETGLDETTVYGDILVYLVGGFHSVSTTLTWCMFHAVLYPDTHTAIYEEVSQVSDMEDISIEAILKLRYLRHFIDETLRLRFVAPVAIRLSGEDTFIAGYKIPPETHIIQALSVVLTSESIWTNPLQFMPQRFDYTNLNIEKDNEKRSPLAFCPFGFAGKRMCPGKQFFYSEALLILWSLFKHFKFELSEETPKDVPIIYGLLTRPAVDVFLKIKGRY